MTVNKLRLASSALLGAILLACSATELDSASPNADAGREPTGPAGPVGPAGPPGPTADAGSVPTHPPSSVSFVDTDLNADSIAGTISLGRAADTSDVTSYAVYYGKSASEKLYLDPIFSAPASGNGDIDFSLNVAPPPADATYLLAFSQNAAGEMATGVATKFHDVAPAAVDIASGLSVYAGSDIVVDATNNKILAVVGDTSDPEYTFKPFLIRCDYDGTACSRLDMSSSGKKVTGDVALAVDPAGGHIYMVFEDALNADKPTLIRCAVDGTTCETPVDISAGQGQGSGILPKIALDTINEKLLVVTFDDSYSTARPSLFRCNLDGSSCTVKDVSFGDPTASFPYFAVDLSTQQLFIGGHTKVSPGYSFYAYCGLDGSVCTIGNGYPLDAPFPTFQASMTLDTSAKNIAFTWLSGSNTVGFSFCDYAGTSCQFEDISAGRPASSGFISEAAIDTTAKQLYVSMLDSADADRIHVNRCKVDGTECQSFAMSPPVGQTAPSIALVPNASHFVTFANGSIYFPQ